MTTQPAETAADLVQTSSDPADEHAAVAPAADMVDEVVDAAVEILDRVRILDKSSTGVVGPFAVPSARAYGAMW